MSMLNFYINRAGKNLPKSQKRVLEHAKDELRDVFGRTQKAVQGRACHSQSFLETGCVVPEFRAKRFGVRRPGAAFLRDRARAELLALIESRSALQVSGEFSRDVSS